MTEWIDLEQAKRAIETGTGKGIKIAVLDSGVESSHPQLGKIRLADDVAVVADGHKLKIVAGEGKDVFGHGTAVAGVIRKVAPECQVGSIRVLGKDNSSRTTIIHRAAQEALDRGYHIVNCSFGCGIEDQVLSYKAWVDEAYLKGVHVVAACNNEDFSRPEWPAYFPSVVAVNMARTNSEDLFYYQHGAMVEFAAQGVDVRVPWSGGTEKVVTGSSFAAPRLAALMARLLSVYPQLTPLQAKAILHRIANRFTARVAADNVLS
ncbi:MAG TPA: S8 family serine peptidase [Terriglobales bacterium]|nr:S8 family serine peptidase [Terriglobales bacterium]